MTTTQQHRTQLFRCPLCNQGEITLVEQPGLWLQRREITPCPTCGARFTARGPGHYTLTRCNAARVARIRALQEPLGCTQCDPCPVGRTHQAGEWEELRRAVHLTPGAAWVSPVEAATSPKLEPGERLRFAQGGILLSEMWPGALSAGDLFATDRRLIYRSATGTLAISLQQITAIEEEARSPAITIRLQGRQEPLTFFARSGDGALRSLVALLRG